MIGYRDSNQPNGHTVALDGLLLEFGAIDGTLWQPTPMQEAVMTLTPLRRDRFVRVELPDAPVAPTDDAPVTEAPKPAEEHNA